MRSPTPGLTARHAIPALRPYVVPRQRLLDRMHGAVGNGLIVLQAPGGYGKTTLAAQFARDVEFEARWLSLDSSSQAPEAFAEQIVSAVLGRDAWQPASMDASGALASYLGVALHEFEAMSTLPLLLVIDNAHELNPSEVSCELLGWLLQSLPLGSEVVLAAREPLQVAEIDRLVAGGDALLLGSNDLGFTPDEVAAVVEHSKDAGADPRTVFEATGGWPVAVRGVITGTLSHATANRAAAGGAWDRYLGGEVWATVPAELQHDLMLAAIPPSAETHLVATLLDAGAWDRLGAWLDERDFFVENVDDRGRRLNPVVQRFLRERLRTTEPDTYQHAVSTITCKLEGEGRVADALEMAISLASHRDLRGLLLQHAPDLLQRGSFVTLRRAFDALETCHDEPVPELTAIRARVLAHLDQPEDALMTADAVLETEYASLEARHHARLARARSLRMLGRMDEVAGALDTPMDDLPSNRALQAEFAWHRAHAALAIDSDLDRALQLLNECLVATKETRTPLLELLCRSTIGQVLVMKGDGPGSVTELSEAARGWREQQGAAHLAWVLNNLGMAHIMVGDMENAIRTLNEAREESVMAHNLRAEAFAVASLGDAYLAFGNAEKARTCYEETIDLCTEQPLDQSLVVMATAGLAGALLSLGDVARADFVVRRAVEMAEELGSPFELASALLHLSAVESASELHAEAVGHATRAVEMLEGIGAEAELRTARYRLALIHFRDGDREAAEQILGTLNESMTAAWMVRGLEPLMREHPLFAQWVEKRRDTPQLVRAAIRGMDFTPPEPAETEAESRYPRVVAQSLGPLRVLRNGEEVGDDAWESVRAKELFYLFLAHPDGIRKEEAFEQLYPDLPASRCNSQFHSNLYRVRKALYKECVIKRDGTYLLNPEGEFQWDVDEFRELLDRASDLPAGSSDRAAAYERAMQVYRGPFAEAFYSEWAASLREELSRRHIEALASLGGYYAGRGEFEAAAACMEQVLRATQFNDEAAAMLATYRARAGQPTSALAFLDDYRSELRRELDEELPHRLSNLRKAIASGAAV